MTATAMIWRRDLEDGNLGDRNHSVVPRAAQCRRDGSVRHRVVVRRDILAGLARQERIEPVTAKTSSWAVKSLCCTSRWQLPLRWLSITTLLLVAFHWLVGVSAGDLERIAARHHDTGAQGASAVDGGLNTVSPSRGLLTSARPVQRVRCTPVAEVVRAADGLI